MMGAMTGPQKQGRREEGKRHRAMRRWPHVRDRTAGV